MLEAEGFPEALASGVGRQNVQMDLGPRRKDSLDEQAEGLTPPSSTAALRHNEKLPDVDFGDGWIVVVLADVESGIRSCDTMCPSSLPSPQVH